MLRPVDTIVEPRNFTPSPNLHAEERIRVPEDVLKERVQRLNLFCAILGGLWTLFLAMRTVILPLTVGGDVSAPRRDDRE